MVGVDLPVVVPVASVLSLTPSVVLLQTAIGIQPGVLCGYAVAHGKVVVTGSVAS